MTQCDMLRIIYRLVIMMLAVFDLVCHGQETGRSRVG